MMVTFVSQCQKNALPKTRRVLDAFANRIGDNTWQTVITEDGLLTVKKMLRQTASKSTAVSCHWIRSRSRSQFLWAVGNKSKFNQEGIVAVNSTEKDLINADYENDWKYMPLIKSLTALAALFHDWGKASKLFQDKLAGKSKHKGDPLRHEWISCLLFNAFVKGNKNISDDKEWLQKIIEGNFDENELALSAAKQDSTPLLNLPKAASLISWLIVSHHRLPLPKNTQQVEGRTNKDFSTMLRRVLQTWGYENKHDEKEYERLVIQCFNFPRGLLSESSAWLRSLKQWATTLSHNLPLLDEAMADGSWRVILHHARLSLMLGDHYYSSKQKAKDWQSDLGVYANTDPKTKALKQQLDEHLVNVAEVALKNVRLLPDFESKPNSAKNIDALDRKNDTPKNFRWQDKSVSKINRWRESTENKITGFFAVNMASTGCGKTIANAKIMRALSDDAQSLRYILALGLRTLTLQTGDEYRSRIGLTDAEFGVLIGSKAITELHQKGKHNKATQENTLSEVGSESSESLLDEEVSWKGELPEEELTTVLTREKDKKLLYAPVLVCTIDHIMAATETKRGGKYILPCLRLMSSDLVIDEIDDFTGNDLIAIGRLIHLAGMLGRKVMISSATIPPDLAEGYFNAYQEGWKIYASSRNKSKDIAIAWIDEFSTQINTIAHSEKSIENFKSSHNEFIENRVKKLIQVIVKRKANIVPCDTLADTAKSQEQYFSIIQQEIIKKHYQHNTLDSKSNINVSFGVVRVANIPPCIALTKYLLETNWPSDIEVRCMAYHSQQVLLLRHEQEKHLDQVLKRKEKEGKDPVAFSNDVIRQHLDIVAKSPQKKNLIFILVATPVEEVGRDHDFDWAVIEPSSYRSIIQLAGRVRRHRDTSITEKNIALMQYNLKGYLEKSEHVFNRPGYESKRTPLDTHDLLNLVDEKELSHAVTAIPRIKKSNDPKPKLKLADLEHLATSIWLTNYTNKTPKGLQGFLTDYWWLTALPQKLTPFRQSEPSTKLYLKVDKEQKVFHERADESGYLPVENIYGISHVTLPKHITDRLWLYRDYLVLVKNEVSEEYSEQQVSVRYGEINITMRDKNNEFEYNDNKYEYDDQFGLVKV
ncbi:type I-F CRISPR-associated helicase Cas3f [Flocculibacter collagenilyticus]|uniref:type I-F CRISPR-associated helicase Cas3f n=1 Tax=Flocculibacter collagenilyticus TaxID=2744479 RepID=UPI0018F65168|nr:type I-F CRISPR-associated helicase Cas3f [Flocculibacter collagenilyticus]